MQYKLTWQEAMKVIFINKSMVVTGVFGILFVLPLLISLFYMQESFFLILVLTIIVPLGVFFVMNFNSGWRIENDVFELKAFTPAKKIKISSMEISMVDLAGNWSPSMRIWGAGFPGLLIGDCRLKNKKTALVFQHLTSVQLLLIAVEGKYYLIGHPGIEALYNTLLDMGARDKKFE